MARRRYLSTDISHDARIARLASEYGDFAALLYTWMIPHADDDASITSDHDEIMYAVIPGLRKHKRRDVDGAIAAMLTLGLLEQGEDCYFFPSEAFYKHQSYIKEERRRKDSAEVPQNAEKLGDTPENLSFAAEPPQNAASVSVPIRSDPLSVLGVDRATAAFATFGKLTAGTGDAIGWSIKDYGPDWVLRAIKTAAGAAFDDRPPWSYVESILERWKKQGKPDDELEVPRGKSAQSLRVGAARGNSRGGSTPVVTDGSDWERYKSGLD